MIQAIISIVKQTGMEEWTTYYKSKTFKKDATLQEIEDWAKTHNTHLTIFDVRFSSIDV